MTEARTFPAFPPRRTNTRGATWWGKAWSIAMEETSLDSGRLARGRTYARTGRVGSITVSPGRLDAPVHGSRGEPYQTVVYVERLGDAGWDRFLDEVAGRAGHIAALLDRDMPHDLVEAAADAGVRLLPTVGDLEPECDCPDWGYPCKHAAALAYQAAWLLDRDPFVLFLLRGRGEPELIADLRRRNARAADAAEATTPATPPGVPAERVYATPPAPLPASVRPPVAEATTGAPGLAAGLSEAGTPGLATGLPDAGTPGLATGLPEAETPVPGLAAGLPEAGTPVPEPALVPAAPGVDPEALGLLVADAAARARDLLAGRWRPLTRWQDTVRIAATQPAAYSRLARAHPELPAAAEAWRCGGLDGLLVWEETWSPPRQEMARARAAIAAAWEGETPPAIRAQRNRWTVVGADAQLRYGRDGRWHPYRKRGARWWPAGPPNPDPATVLADLIVTTRS